ncbi:ferritin [Candidatus Altiarchaeota archaeon]
MEVSKKIEEALNGQINAELYSSYLYLGMGGYFESLNLSGFAHWMRIQAQEELLHGLKIYDYVIERGGNAALDAIDKPSSGWKSALSVFEAAYEHEKKVTKMINDIVDMAHEERDHATVSFLNWFVDEQVEEESSADAIVQQLKLIGDAKGALVMYDRELAQRPAKLMPVLTQE